MAQTPFAQVPRITHCAANNESLAIDDIPEQTERDVFFAPVQHSHRRARADVERDQAGGVRTGAEIAGGPIADRVENQSVSQVTRGALIRSFADNVELLWIDPARFAQFCVPGFFSQIVKAGCARHRMAGPSCAENFCESPIGG